MKFEDLRSIDYQNVYNKELKEQFLTDNFDDNESMIVNYIRLFNRTGVIEAGSQKDLCKFNFAENISMFESLGMTTYSSFNTSKTLIGTYNDYCTIKGYTDAETAYSIRRLEHSDLKGTVSYERKMFKDYDEVKSFIMAVRESVGADKWLMKEAIFILAYLGCALEDIPYIKKSDLKEDKSILIYKDKSITLKPFERSILYDAKTAETAERSEGIWVNYNDTPFLIRTLGAYLGGVEVSKVFIKRAFTDFSLFAENLPIENEFYGKKVTFLSAQNSGYYHRLHDHMKKHNDIVLSYSYREKISEIINLDLCTSITKYYTFIRNYEQWSEYYGL